MISDIKEKLRPLEESLRTLEAEKRSYQVSTVGSQNDSLHKTKEVMESAVTDRNIEEFM